MTVVLNRVALMLVSYFHSAHETRCVLCVSAVITCTPDTV